RQPAADGQEQGGDVGAEPGDEDQQAGGDDAGPGQRDDDARQHPAGRGVEIEAGLDQAEVELLQAGIEGQHHEGQEAVEQAQQDGGIGVEDDDRPVDGTEPDQEVVDQPLVADDQHDRISAD